MKKIGIFTIGMADPTQGGSGVINYLLCDELMKNGLRIKIFFLANQDFLNRHYVSDYLKELENRGLEYEIIKTGMSTGSFVFGKKLFCQLNQYEGCAEFIKKAGEEINNFDAIISFGSGWAMALADVEKPLFRVIEDPIQLRMKYGKNPLFFSPVFWKRKIQFWSINSKRFFRWLKKKWGEKHLLFIFSPSDAELYRRHNIDCRYFRIFTPEVKKIERSVCQSGKLIALHIGTLESTGSMKMIDYLTKDLLPELTQLPFKIEIRFIGRWRQADKEKLSAKNWRNIELSFIGFVKSLEEEISKADFFFSPIRYPVGVRTRVVTALSYGLPVVADKTVSLGAPELVDGRDIIYTSNGKETRVVLERAYNNPKWLAEIGENGRLVWEKLYHPGKNVREIIKLLNLE